ncbi:hypothetical protein [Streptomyces sp. YS-3]|uniref:hypothetical protein n=1 Tax=Streptomyces sp. YS-3 TaxID=3381352 RepID=UPI003862C2A7
MSSRTTRSRQAHGTDADLLAIYLNDHLLGATVGVERARYLAEECTDPEVTKSLEPIAKEIAEDRKSLVGIMRRLDISVRRYKVYAGRLAERVGRLKSNGSLVRRSPLTTMVELEFLRLGVEGKAAVWQTLRELTDAEERLDGQQLNVLTDRATRQLSTLEELRRRQARKVFTDD